MKKVVLVTGASSGIGKETAIDWLVENLYYILKTEHYDIIDQAKEMEKQQIIDAYDEGYGTRDAFGDVTENNTGEQHYTETYGK